MIKGPLMQINRLFENFARYIFLTAISLLCLPSISQAAEQVEKIHIDADHMQMNIESGKSIYTGNVKISQGELILLGDKVTLEQSNKEVERIIVTGKPARYNHITEKGETIKAESEHMVYTASQNKLVMTINAHLQQPGHKLSSQKIIYDTQKSTVIAGSSQKTLPGKTGTETSTETKERQRVNITLTPKKSQTEEPQSQK